MFGLYESRLSFLIHKVFLTSEIQKSFVVVLSIQEREYTSVCRNGLMRNRVLINCQFRHKNAAQNARSPFLRKPTTLKQNLHSPVQDKHSSRSLEKKPQTNVPQKHYSTPKKSLNPESLTRNSKTPNAKP